MTISWQDNKILCQSTAGTLKRLQLTEGDPPILLLLPPQRGQSPPSLHPLLTMKTTNSMTQVSALLQSSRNKRAEEALDLGHTEDLVLA